MNTYSNVAHVKPEDKIGKHLADCGFDRFNNHAAVVAPPEDLDDAIARVRALENFFSANPRQWSEEEFYTLREWLTQWCGQLAEGLTAIQDLDPGKEYVL